VLLWLREYASGNGCWLGVEGHGCDSRVRESALVFCYFPIDTQPVPSRLGLGFGDGRLRHRFRDYDSRPDDSTAQPLCNYRPPISEQKQERHNLKAGSNRGGRSSGPVHHAGRGLLPRRFCLYDAGVRDEVFTGSVSVLIHVLFMSYYCSDGRVKGERGRRVKGGQTRKGGHCCFFEIIMCSNAFIRRSVPASAPPDVSEQVWQLLPPKAAGQ